MRTTTLARVERAEREEPPISCVVASPERLTPDFHDIYRTWSRSVARWVRSLGGSDADRDDLVQDVFVIVHRRLCDFDGENTGGWLYQITKRRVRDYRKRLWFRHRNDHTSPDQLRERADGPLEILQTKQRLECLAVGLESISPRNRAALLLFELDGLSGEEIAAREGVSLNTTWSRIRRAREKLLSATIEAPTHCPAVASGSR